MRVHKNYLIDFEADGNDSEHAQELFMLAEDIVADLFETDISQYDKMAKVRNVLG